MKPVLFMHRGAWCCFRYGTNMGHGETPSQAYIGWVYKNTRAMR